MVHYFSQIIQAVGSLHRSGFIHRDLKPENILIDSKGDLLLTDCEFARHLQLETDDMFLLLVVFLGQYHEYQMDIIWQKAAGNGIRGKIIESSNFEVDFRMPTAELWTTVKKLFTEKGATIDLLNLQTIPEKLISSKASERSQFKLENYSIDSQFKSNSPNNRQPNAFKHFFPLQNRFSEFKNISPLKFNPIKLKNRNGFLAGGNGKFFNKRMTLVTEKKGSCEYLAPECHSDSHFSMASDFWALGCCIFDLYTQTHLFQLEESLPSHFPEAERKKRVIKKIYEFQSYKLNSSDFSKKGFQVIKQLLSQDLESRVPTYDCFDLFKEPWLEHVKMERVGFGPSPFLPDKVNVHETGNKDFYVDLIEYQNNPHFDIKYQFKNKLLGLKAVGIQSSLFEDSDENELELMVISSKDSEAEVPAMEHSSPNNSFSSKNKLNKRVSDYNPGRDLYPQIYSKLIKSSEFDSKSVIFKKSDGLQELKYRSTNNDTREQSGSNIQSESKCIQLFSEDSNNEVANISPTFKFSNDYLGEREQNTFAKSNRPESENYWRTNHLKENEKGGWINKTDRNNKRDLSISMKNKFEKLLAEQIVWKIDENDKGKSSSSKKNRSLVEKSSDNSSNNKKNEASKLNDNFVTSSLNKPIQSMSFKNIDALVNKLKENSNPENFILQNKRKIKDKSENNSHNTQENFSSLKSQESKKNSEDKDLDRSNNLIVGVSNESSNDQSLIQPVKRNERSLPPRSNKMDTKRKNKLKAKKNHIKKQQQSRKIKIIKNLHRKTMGSWNKLMKPGKFKKSKYKQLSKFKKLKKKSNAILYLDKISLGIMSNQTRSFSLNSSINYSERVSETNRTNLYNSLFLK